MSGYPAYNALDRLEISQLDSLEALVELKTSAIRRSQVVAFLDCCKNQWLRLATKLVCELRRHGKQHDALQLAVECPSLEDRTSMSLVSENIDHLLVLRYDELWLASRTETYPYIGHIA